MTVAELHAKMKQDKAYKQQAKMRHLKRAFAGIDKSQFQDQNHLFNTIDRNTADRVFSQVPNGTEVGRYNPMHISRRAPSYKMAYESLTTSLKKDPFKDRSPSIKYANSARCKNFAPNPQHDEQPTVNCHKLDQKLERFKNQITQSSKR